MPRPDKFNLFGVGVSAATYDAATEYIMNAALRKESALVTHLPVHGLIVASRDASFRRKINSFDIVGPDGHPVRWALDYFHGQRLPDRLYGPQHMSRLCDSAAKLQVPIYLYGSSPQVIAALRRRLVQKVPSLVIAGAESPPFRPLTPDEDQAVVARINGSGARIVFLGLGCPLQDNFAYDHRDSIEAVQVCVGAAFDFHAGTKRMAPRWVQNHSLEWAFRLFQEPGRLWRRYLETNSVFLYLVAKQIIAARLN